jgi:hypothetical protein
VFPDWEELRGGFIILASGGMRLNIKICFSMIVVGASFSIVIALVLHAFESFAY